MNVVDDTEPFVRKSDLFKGSFPATPPLKNSKTSPRRQNGHGGLRISLNTNPSFFLNITICSAWKSFPFRGEECIATTKDWRKCQTEVEQFRNCIGKHKQEEMTKKN
ncbi:hypothetical protein MSG28_014573 [Choristoneura fumiferana]|uniref:Uncharacterized protein n=1 Tax=Choristoneura fumiferana TaxID=7141 RepID=A0ACC0JS03_CHOFU|nr:hypothetical protein MSG28_014573 [Choristoneura fumiferana]